MGWSLASLFRRRARERAEIDPELWQAMAEHFHFLHPLNDEELARLRDKAAIFLADKSIHAAGDLELDEGMELAIAVQACILILELDYEWFEGWVEVIVYPDQFLPEREWVDDAGVVHLTREPMAGEAWLGGPVILSWADVEWGGNEECYNVVIHEFAHKLDMRNGEPNGFPSLHAGMSREDWSRAFGAAFEHFRARVDAGEDTEIDPYAAEEPGEFFAVFTEAFFETPRTVKREYPEVYEQLCRFYRQDPVARLAR